MGFLLLFKELTEMKTNNRIVSNDTKRAARGVGL